MTPPSLPERRRGLDLLRFYLMALGVLLHSFCPYLTSYKIPEFPIADPTLQHVFFDGVVLWIHSFRMPLFFMISGFFTMGSLERSDGLPFLLKRVRRIALPLVVCALLFLPVFRWSIAHWQSAADSSSFQLSFLWFLYYLFLLNLLVVGFRKLYLHTIATLRSRGPFLVFWSALLGFSMFFFFQSKTGVLKTSDGFLPDIGLFTFYFLYFALGSALWARQTLNQRNPWPRLPAWLRHGTAALLSVAYISCVQKIYLGEATFLWPASVLHSLLTPMISFGLFSTFSRLPVHNPRTSTYLAKSSYTIYLVHPLFVAVFVPWLAYWRPGSSLNPMMVFGVSLSLSLAVYHTIVRTTPLRHYI